MKHEARCPLASILESIQESTLSRHLRQVRSALGFVMRDEGPDLRDLDGRHHARAGVLLADDGGDDGGRGALDGQKSASGQNAEKPPLAEEELQERVRNRRDPMFVVDGGEDLIPKLLGEEQGPLVLAGGTLQPVIPAPQRAQDGGCGLPFSTRVAQAASSSHSVVRCSR